jgi:hypothetical protein
MCSVILASCSSLVHDAHYTSFWLIAVSEVFEDITTLNHWSHLLMVFLGSYLAFKVSNEVGSF